MAHEAVPSYTLTISVAHQGSLPHTKTPTRGSFVHVSNIWLERWTPSRREVPRVSYGLLFTPSYPGAMDWVEKLFRKPSPINGELEEFP